jgi:tetratricopeptide (TPR) repeat protein
MKPIVDAFSYLLFAVALILSTVFCARAQDMAPYRQLLADHQFNAVESAARVRLNADRGDTAAQLAIARAIVELRDLKRYEDAERMLNACLTAQPKSSLCSLWLARTYGTQIDGMFSAMRLAPKAKLAFENAVEFDPNAIEPRSALVEFYVKVPGALGGGKDKAQSQIADFSKLKPGPAKLLQVHIEIDAKQYRDAEAILAAVPASSSEDLQTVHSYLYVVLGGTLLMEKQFADAQRVFEAGTKRFPEMPEIITGLGRSLYEQSKFDEAIVYLERANTKLQSAKSLYRLGLAWQASGNRPKASALMQQALAAVPSLPSDLRKDAEVKLKSIK